MADTKKPVRKKRTYLTGYVQINQLKDRLKRRIINECKINEDRFYAFLYGRSKPSELEQEKIDAIFKQELKVDNAYQLELL
jgi:hypothetical protein